MSRWLLVLVALSWATVAQATPVAYTFSGTLGLRSALTEANGATADLIGIAFTVTGTTLDLPTPAGYRTGMFLATSRYDFGAFGSFQTDEGGDLFMEMNMTTDPTVAISRVGLALWYPSTLDGLQGFMVDINPIVGVSLAAPIAIGTVDPIDPVAHTSSFFRSMANAEGQRLLIGANLQPTQALLTIDHVDVHDAPEPATLTLLALGFGLLVTRHRH